MSEEFLPSLFEAFARERNTTMGKVAGTGLGMPIIKKYIDMMYGTIAVSYTHLAISSLAASFGVPSSFISSSAPSSSVS